MDKEKFLAYVRKEYTQELYAQRNLASNDIESYWYIDGEVDMLSRIEMLVDRGEFDG